MHSLFLDFTHTKFPFGTGAFAHMICFLAGNGRVIVLRRREMFKSSGLGSILEWVRLAWPRGVAVVALHGKASYT